jgi:hypothetical protein
MRLNEFTSAEEQLGLLRVIIDSTWTAIAQQAEAEAKQKAERAAARKSTSKRGAGRGTAKPIPPKRLPPPLQHVTAPVAKADDKTTSEKKPQAHKAQAHNAQPQNSQQAQPTAKPELSTAPAALPTQQKVVGMPQPLPNAATPQAAHLQQPHATQQPLTPQQMRLQRQNVGYLAKNSAAIKRL